MATRFVDSVITYRILRLLVTPFVDTDAYKLGIVDNRGKELKRMRDLHTVKERDAYTLLHRLVFRLKRIIEKVPVENKKLLSFAAALALIKEHHDKGIEPVTLEQQFLSFLKEDTDLSYEIGIVNSFIQQKKILPFYAFYEDAPVNNAAATPGIDSLAPGTVVVKRKPKLLTRKKLPGINN